MTPLAVYTRIMLHPKYYCTVLGGASVFGHCLIGASTEFRKFTYEYKQNITANSITLTGNVVRSTAMYAGLGLFNTLFFPITIPCWSYCMYKRGCECPNSTIPPN